MISNPKNKAGDEKKKRQNKKWMGLLSSSIGYFNKNENCLRILRKIYLEPRIPDSVLGYGTKLGNTV